MYSKPPVTIGASLWRRLPEKNKQQAIPGRRAPLLRASGRTIPPSCQLDPGRAGIFVCMDAISAHAFVQCMCPPLTHGSIKPPSVRYCTVSFYFNGPQSLCFVRPFVESTGYGLHYLYVLYTSKLPASYPQVKPKLYAVSLVPLTY